VSKHRLIEESETDPHMVIPADPPLDHLSRMEVEPPSLEELSMTRGEYYTFLLISLCIGFIAYLQEPVLYIAGVSLLLVTVMSRWTFSEVRHKPCPECGVRHHPHCSPRKGPS
jgi:hypothetical protein